MGFEGQLAYKGNGYGIRFVLCIFLFTGSPKRRKTPFSKVDINRMGIKFDPPINRSSHRLSPAQLLVALLTFVSKKKSTQPRLQVKDHMILAPSAARPDPGWLSITEDIFS
ncbi:hypothetical protein MRB53_015902 [Persea americana]|uniref:Uncharacterized protein n=1 Tax=Persea americana TaxID=3435 RepID=A0ACC2M173_PERAE|nr:hypothetical protein MRB53_015902 [Persea americana]